MTLKMPLSKRTNAGLGTLPEDSMAGPPFGYRLAACSSMDELYFNNKSSTGLCPIDKANMQIRNANGLPAWILYNFVKVHKN